MRQWVARAGLLVFLSSAAIVATADCVGDDVTPNNVPTTPEAGAGDAPTTDSPSGIDAPIECGAPTNDFYVDSAKGADTNKGSGATCPFKTIKAALAASANHFNATIHLAAGTYGAGETFPIVVDKGRSLVGPGASTTTIQGSSAEFNTSNTGSKLDEKDASDSKYFVSILAGDVMGGPNNLGATTLSGFTVLPASSITAPTKNYWGVACIAGNGPNTGTTPPLPTPSLIVKAVTVGPNFDVGISIGSSPTNGSACNASIVTSTFLKANAGVLTGTCGQVNPSTSWPSTAVGNGQPADANTFKGPDIGIFGEGCGSVQVYSANRFVSGYRGIVAVSNAAQYFEITSNTFDGATAPKMGIGLQTSPGVILSKLNDNTFTNIAQSADADTAASTTTGFAIDFAGTHILQAMRNAIHDNDNGLRLRASPATDFDFSGGTNAIVNRNQFFCNSKIPGNGNGYDIYLDYTIDTATPGKFTGNAWDNTPVTTGNLSAANGVDVASAGGSIDASSPVAKIATACASGREK